MSFLSRLFARDSAPAVTTDTDNTATLVTGGIGGGWSNPVTGLGAVGTDPTAQLVYCGGRIPTAMMIDKLYTFDWLAQRVVEKMPSIALVRGVKGVAPALWDKFQALNVTARFPKGAFFRAICDGRAYGGAVLLVGYAQGAPWTPLTPEQRKGGILFLDVFAQHELRVLSRVTDPSRPDFGMPEIYEVVANVYGPRHPRTGQMFHASRAIRFSGHPLRVPNTAIEVNDTTGAHSQPELGVSVLTPILTVLGQYGLAWSAASNMLADASIGWMKVAGLVEALASEDKDLIEDRLRVLQQTKSVHRMMFLDADNNEEYGRTEVSLTDVPTMLQQFIVSVSGAADMPARIFFGTSPQGLNANSSNESDLTQLYNSANDYQLRELGPSLNVLLTAVNDGNQVKVEWPSLWCSSDNEVAQTRLAVANATKVYWDMGACEASDIVKAAQTGTQPELIGKPDDDRTSLAGEPEEVPPAGAPGKQTAGKIATKQRAEQKK